MLTVTMLPSCSAARSFTAPSAAPSSVALSLVILTVMVLEQTKPLNTSLQQGREIAGGAKDQGQQVAASTAGCK